MTASRHYRTPGPRALSLDILNFLKSFFSSEEKYGLREKVDFGVVDDYLQTKFRGEDRCAQADPDVEGAGRVCPETLSAPDIPRLGSIPVDGLYGHRCFGCRGPDVPLSPSGREHTWYPFWTVFSVLAVAFLNYGFPVMELWIPSRVNLFPHHLAASDRMIRFHLISRYAWRREIEGWVLELTCANEKKSFVSIPNDVVRKQVEEVLEKAGTAKDGLAPEEAARRRETDEWVASKLEEFRHGTRKFGLWCLLWFYIVLGACGILNLIYLYYFHKNNLILGIGLIVAFAGLFGSRVVETRFIKKLARSQGLACTHCAKPMTLVGLAHLRKTGKCLYCGKVLSFKAEADV